MWRPHKTDALSKFRKSIFKIKLYRKTEMKVGVRSKRQKRMNKRKTGKRKTERRKLMSSL